VVVLGVPNATSRPRPSTVLATRTVPPLASTFDHDKPSISPRGGGSTRGSEGTSASTLDAMSSTATDVNGTAVAYSRAAYEISVVPGAEATPTVQASWASASTLLVLRNCRS
jgi:hypothetical protein